MRSDRFEWDDEKAALNLLKHGIRFEQAEEVFADPLIATFADRSHSTDEDRQISIGSTFWDEVLIVSHTTCDERIRIISARHATKPNVANS